MTYKFDHPRFRSPYMVDNVPDGVRKRDFKLVFRPRHVEVWLDGLRYFSKFKNARAAHREIDYKLRVRDMVSSYYPRVISTMQENKND